MPVHAPVSVLPLLIQLAVVEDVRQVPVILAAADNQDLFYEYSRRICSANPPFLFFIHFRCQKLDTPLNPSYLLR